MPNYIGQPSRSHGNIAYEATVEDVETVLRSNVLADAKTNGMSFESMAEELHGDLDFDLIVQAALAGDDLDEQTDYANDEIARQLREMGVLEPLDAQKPVTKQPRPLEPKASAELVERVMAMVDAYSKKPMIRRTGTGYIVAMEPKTKRALAVVDGDFGRAEFKAVYAEIAEASLASDSIIVVANTATYTGRSIHFSKFEDLGLIRAEESKDERPIPGM